MVSFPVIWVVYYEFLHPNLHYEYHYCVEYKATWF